MVTFTIREYICTPGFVLHIKDISFHVKISALFYFTNSSWKWQRACPQGSAIENYILYKMRVSYSDLSLMSLNI